MTRVILYSIDKSNLKCTISDNSINLRDKSIFVIFYFYSTIVFVIEPWECVSVIIKWTPLSHAMCLLLPPATKLGQGYVFTPVCQSFCSHVHRGVCLPLLENTPTQADTPWQTPSPLADNPQADTAPPGQCMLGYGQQVGGTHPTGLHTCCEENLKYLLRDFGCIVLTKPNDCTFLDTCISNFNVGISRQFTR